MKRVILTVCLILFSNTVFAETGFQFAAPNLNLPSDPDVSGMRLSLLHGKNQSISGLDFGLLSLAETSRLSGLALVAGVSKVNDEMSGGAAFSLVNYHTGRDSGVNAAFINLLNEAGGAFNIGFVTIAKGETMVDLGGFVMSNSSTAQIGFVNITKNIKSFQIGFLNIAENGFMPVFPFFNFPKN
jgi:hypothetical protein